MAGRSEGSQYSLDNNPENFLYIVKFKLTPKEDGKFGIKFENDLISGLDAQRRCLNYLRVGDKIYFNGDLVTSQNSQEIFSGKTEVKVSVFLTAEQIKEREDLKEKIEKRDNTILDLRDFSYKDYYDEMESKPIPQREPGKAPELQAAEQQRKGDEYRSV